MSRSATLSPMPLDVRLMNRLAWMLALVFAAMVLAVVGKWLAQQPGFSLRAIRIDSELQHNNAVTLRANVAPKLMGNFFTLDLAQAKSAFESVPWVRHAVVQREFPNRLKVTLEEHQAVAWWGESGSGRLVNRLGEVFEANPDEGQELPELAGPDHQSAQVWALFQRMENELQRLDLGLVRLQLTERGSWRADLHGGARIELGRGDAEQLLARVQRLTGTLSQLTARYPGALESVDLRYPNGYALRVRGVSTLIGSGPTEPPNTR